MPKSKKTSETKGLINQKTVKFLDKPENLTNEYMQDMGKNYVNKAEEIKKKNVVVKLFSPHINKDIAQMLSDYNNESQPYKKWEFLAELCKELKSYDELAVAIITLFETVFKRKTLIKVKCPEKHSAYLSMNDIAESLKGISSQYFVKHYDELCNELKLELEHPKQKIDSSPVRIDSQPMIYM